MDYYYLLEHRFFQELSINLNPSIVSAISYRIPCRISIDLLSVGNVYTIYFPKSLVTDSAISSSDCFSTSTTQGELIARWGESISRAVYERSLMECHHTAWNHYSQIKSMYAHSFSTEGITRSSSSNAYRPDSPVRFYDTQEKRVETKMKVSFNSEYTKKKLVMPEADHEIELLTLKIKL